MRSRNQHLVLYSFEATVLKRKGNHAGVVFASLNTCVAIVLKSKALMLAVHHAEVEPNQYLLDKLSFWLERMRADGDCSCMVIDNSCFTEQRNKLGKTTDLVAWLKAKLGVEVRHQSYRLGADKNWLSVAAATDKVSFGTILESYQRGDHNARRSLASMTRSYKHWYEHLASRSPAARQRRWLTAQASIASTRSHSSITLLGSKAFVAAKVSESDKALFTKEHVQTLQQQNEKTGLESALTLLKQQLLQLRKTNKIIADAIGITPAKSPYKAGKAQDLDRATVIGLQNYLCVVACLAGCDCHTASQKVDTIMAPHR